MSDVAIYHNHKCGTSSNTLAKIRNSGGEPKVIHHMETPSSRCELVNAQIKTAPSRSTEKRRFVGSPIQTPQNLAV